MTKAAIAQIEPIWFDLAGTVAKTIATILSAGKDNIALLGFPEIFIPGFPHFLAALSIADGGTLCQHYHTQSMSLHGPEMMGILNACKQASVWIVLGFSEKTASGTLHMSQVIISSEGKIEMHRQKLKPSHYERMLFGDGGAPGVMNVVETPFGRLGSLNCWEHFMPLLKFNTFSQNEQIHVGSWPSGLKHNPGNPSRPFSMSYDGARNASRQYAMEGGVFVLHAAAVRTDLYKQRLAQLGVIQSTPHGDVNGGGASVAYGPDGTQLAIPENDEYEGLIVVDIDIGRCAVAKGTLDTCGHYSRPDIFCLQVDARQKRQSVVTR